MLYCMDGQKREPMNPVQKEIDVPTEILLKAERYFGNFDKLTRGAVRRKKIGCEKKIRPRAFRMMAEWIKTIYGKNFSSMNYVHAVYQTDEKTGND